MLKDIGDKFRAATCVHGEPWAGKYCERCVDDRIEREQVCDRALQAMHDLCVWFLCHGWTDCDAELATHGQCRFCEEDPCVCAKGE